MVRAGILKLTDNVGIRDKDDVTYEQYYAFKIL